MLCYDWVVFHCVICHICQLLLFKWVWAQPQYKTIFDEANKSPDIHFLVTSVQFSCLVVSNSLWPHGLQHTRPPCPSPTPEVHPNSCPLSQWCHPTISSSVVPFSHLQSFSASKSFPVSQFFTSGGQSTRVSASTSVLPMNIQGWFPLGLTALISLLST